MNFQNKIYKKNKNSHSNLSSINVKIKNKEKLNRFKFSFAIPIVKKCEEKTRIFFANFVLNRIRSF